jgi:predicted membrane metal-binding protein
MLLLRRYTPLRVAIGLIVLALLWHLVGSLSWVTDIGFAVWVVFVIELIVWYDRRRRRADTRS